MEEVKKKRGLKPGMTNNPKGRLPGSKNKYSLAIKERIVNYIEGDWDNLVQDITMLDLKDSVKARIDLIKIVTPRPQSDEEKENYERIMGGLAHLFGQQKKKAEDE